MRRSGLTLLELVVVMMVCGLMMALAIPRLADLRDASAVRSAVAELGAAFATARHLAVTRRANVAIVFDTANGAVQLRSAGETYSRHALRAKYSVSLRANRDSAVYDPRGLGYGISNVSVTLRRGSFVDTLTMSRLGRTAW